MIRALRSAAAGATVIAALGLVKDATAQGAGSTGLEVAQVSAGARAGAMAGAYSAMRTDADGVFYNPASVTGLLRGAGLSYQRHVMDISFGSLAGTASLGRVAVGAGFAFMDGGEVPEIVPDERFGDQRGRPTGATVSARESTFRLAVAAPFVNDRVHVGGSVGFALSELAGVSRSAPFIDLGVQAVASARGTVGVSLRNLGGSLSGSGAEDADLPLEARLGGTYRVPVPGQIGFLLAADLVNRIHEESTGLAFGFESGLMPADDGIGAVLRFGYRAENDLPSRNALQLGAGISYNEVSVDYQYQDLEFLGTAHRVGVRWHRR